MQKLLKAALFAGVLAVVAGVVLAGTRDKWGIETGASNTPILRIPEAGTSLLPGTDNAFALGSASKRYSDVQALDMTLGDDLTVTDDATVSDDMVIGSTVTETLTINGLVRLAKHITPDASVTPTETGQLIWNITPTTWELCQSTGASVGAWVKFSTPTAACSN